MNRLSFAWPGPSIGRRVLAAMLIAFVGVWLMLLAYFYVEFRQALAVDQGLKKLGRAMSASLREVDSDAQAVGVMRSTATQFRTLRISGNPGGSVWMELRRRDDGAVLYRSASLGGRVLDALAPQVIERDFDGISYWVHGTEAGRWRLQLAEPRITGWWVLERNATRLLPYLLLAFPIVLLPVWLAVRLGLRPLQRLADLIARRGSSDLSPIGYDPPQAELKPLTSALERMLRQLRDKLTQERAFVHDAAHELRTPMAVIAAPASANARNCIWSRRSRAPRTSRSSCSTWRCSTMRSPRRRSASTWRSSRAGCSRRRCRRPWHAASSWRSRRPTACRPRSMCRRCSRCSRTCCTTRSAMCPTARRWR
jgi:two-component system, OmpR family, sensor histidine kinase QseC